MAKIWVVDDELSQKYPIYTRGNVGEVFPEAVAPLSWTLAGRGGGEPGLRGAVRGVGGLARDQGHPGGSAMDHFRELFAEHLFITYCSTVPVGALNQIAAQLGDPGLAMRLVAGVGGVDSAAPSWALWELARQVAASPALMAQFDKGV